MIGFCTIPGTTGDAEVTEGLSIEPVGLIKAAAGFPGGKVLLVMFRFAGVYAGRGACMAEGAVVECVDWFDED